MCSWLTSLSPRLGPELATFAARRRQRREVPRLALWRLLAACAGASGCISIARRDLCYIMVFRPAQSLTSWAKWWDAHQCLGQNGRGLDLNQRPLDYEVHHEPLSSCKLRVTSLQIEAERSTARNPGATS